MGLKYWGGKFLINKIHSSLSYLLCAAACKGIPEHSFCKASDSLHCVSKLFLCALKPKLLLRTFKQMAEAPEAGATSTLGRQQTHQRLIRILFGKPSNLHTEKCACVFLWVCKDTYASVLILTGQFDAVWKCSLRYLKAKSLIYGEEYSILRKMLYVWSGNTYGLSGL